MKDVARAVEQEVIIGAPVDLVWHAWTMAERVSQWFAPEAIIDAADGGPYELYFIPGNKTGMNTRGCKILGLVPAKELIFQWKGPDQFHSVMNNARSLTSVHVTFEAIDERHTKVIVKHYGFLDGEAWDGAVQWHEMAWSGVLKSLKNALESGKGDLCCQPE
jgi:uncharacterized protein YndB with AHSA1/START domain